MFNWKDAESTWKSLKMTVADDVTITEEALEVLVAEEAQVQEEKVALLQDAKALVADIEMTEIQLQREKVAFRLTDQPEDRTHKEAKVFQVELQDVLKVRLTHLDQEDQEENNRFLLIFL